MFTLFVLQRFKGAVPHGCWSSVQGWSSYHWTQRQLPETGRWPPHPRGFPDHRVHWVGKWVRMTLNVAILKVRGLRDPSKCAHLLGELSNLCVNVAAVQETHYIFAEDCRVPESNFVVFSAFGSHCSTVVSLLVGCSLNVIVNLVFADDEAASCGWCCR